MNTCIIFGIIAFITEIKTKIKSIMHYETDTTLAIEHSRGNAFSRFNIQTIWLENLSSSFRSCTEVPDSIWTWMCVWKQSKGKSAWVVRSVARVLFSPAQFPSSMQNMQGSIHHQSAVAVRALWLLRDMGLVLFSGGLYTPSRASGGPHVSPQVPIEAFWADIFYAGYPLLKCQRTDGYKF